jgi:hypothetical protein
VGLAVVVVGVPADGRPERRKQGHEDGRLVGFGVGADGLDHLPQDAVKGLGRKAVA